MGLRFTAARSGSIVLVAALPALSYWLIQNTVGETLKDAYKETGMHERLKQLFLARLGGQTEDLGSALSGRLVRLTADAPALVSVSVEQHGVRSVVSISVTISGEREQSLPPPIHEWLVRNG